MAKDDAFLGQKFTVFSINQPEGVTGIYCGKTTDLGPKMWIIKLDNGDDFLMNEIDIFDVLIKYDLTPTLELA